MSLLDAGIAVLWVGGSGYLYVQIQRYVRHKPHLTSDPEKIKALEEELRPWEPWWPDKPPPRVEPQQSYFMRVLLSGTPGPETREWLYRPGQHDMRCVCTTCEEQHHHREEDER